MGGAELVEKLAALVPPPRFNLVRYHGILAPSAAWRALVIPSEPGTADSIPHPDCPARKQPDTGNSQKKRGCRPRNYSWVELMKRVSGRTCRTGICLPRHPFRVQNPARADHSYDLERPGS